MKPVKAWAVVFLDDKCDGVPTYFTRKRAIEVRNLCVGVKCKVIPVLITPLKRKVKK